MMGTQRATALPSDAAIRRAWWSAIEAAVEDVGGEEKFAERSEEILRCIVNAASKYNSADSIALMTISIAAFVVGYIRAAEALDADCGRAVRLHILEAVQRVKIGCRDARS